MKTLIILPVLFLGISCVPSTVGKVETGNSSKTAPYLWEDNTFPKTVLIADSFTGDEKAKITSMGAAWKTVVEDKKTFFDHGTSTTPEMTNSIANMDAMLDPVMGVYKTVNWPTNFPTSALAVTQIFGTRYNAGEVDEFVDIEHADILVNYDDYDFYSSTKTPGSDEFDLRTVVLHEMGHFLGLQHRESSDSVMVTSVGHTTISRKPKTLDKMDIGEKYHLSFASSAAATIAETPRVYKKRKSAGKLKVLIELHAHGECVHKENGAVIGRHPASVKK